MSEHRQPNLPHTDHPTYTEDDKTEAQAAGESNLGDTPAAQEDETREETIAELKREFASFQPSVWPRDVEDNDPEWQRTGGAPVKSAKG